MNREHPVKSHLESGGLENITINGTMIINQFDLNLTESPAGATPYDIIDLWQVSFYNVTNLFVTSDPRGLIRLRGIGQKGQSIRVRNIDRGQSGAIKEADDYRITAAVSLKIAPGSLPCELSVLPRRNNAGVVDYNKIATCRPGRGRTESRDEFEAVSIVRDDEVGTPTYDLHPELTITLLATGPFDYYVYNFKEHGGAYRKVPQHTWLNASDELLRVKWYLQTIGAPGGLNDPVVDVTEQTIDALVGDGDPVYFDTGTNVWFKATEYTTQPTGIADLPSRVVLFGPMLKEAGGLIPGQFHYLAPAGGLTTENRTGIKCGYAVSFTILHVDIDFQAARVEIFGNPLSGSLSNHRVVYFSTAGWQLADNTIPSTFQNKQLGFLVGQDTSLVPDFGSVVTFGLIKGLSLPIVSGDKIYLSTAGNIVNSPPITGSRVPCGYSLYLNSFFVDFNPPSTDCCSSVNPIEHFTTQFSPSSVPEEGGVVADYMASMPPVGQFTIDNTDPILKQMYINTDVAINFATLVIPADVFAISVKIVVSWAGIFTEAVPTDKATWFAGPQLRIDQGGEPRWFGLTVNTNSTDAISPAALRMYRQVETSLTVPAANFNTWVVKGDATLFSSPSKMSAALEGVGLPSPAGWLASSVMNVTVVITNFWER